MRIFFVVDQDFYLLTDSSLACCYLVSKWIENLGELPNFKGILVREDRLSDKIQQDRNLFHTKYAEKKYITDEMNKKILELYPDFDEIEKAMIGLFGIPQYSAFQYDKTVFMGSDLNGKYAKNWLSDTCKYSRSWVFTSIYKILKPWWIEIAKSQILNVHSAVLPYARGLHSIENIAALKDIDQMRKVTGSTIHYIDAGIDTGLIIRIERIVDPFRFNSIWELKGYVYMNGFNLYLKTVKDIISNNETIPVGIVMEYKIK